MPTGIAIRDVRQQLFGAAERILLRDGPSALTSRAVTAEAGVAKGVLHRHFEDFDDFLAAFVVDRYEQLAPELTKLSDAVGRGAIVDNVTDLLTVLFGSVAVAIVPLIIFRDDLRARLRRTWPKGIPILNEASEILVDYLTAERDRGRLEPRADINALGLALIGGAHLLSADRAEKPERATVRNAVTAVLAGVTA